ncbi:MAG: TIGR00341 family protein [Candidatus Paceibacterota bacterium]
MEIKKESLKSIRTYIGPFHIDPERQRKVYDEIKTNAENDFDFSVLTVFAGIIITLGLIIDSSAVVIGGMLLAPLVWPILALSLGLVEGKSKLIQNSAYTLLKSAIAIFLISFAMGFISPEYALTGGEFLARTSPTIFELFIALASGFVGAFVITYPKIGSAIAGVVIAAALVPPIAVMGISIAHRNLSLVGGAFLLFLSNLIAVTFSASLLFMVAKFKGPSSEIGQEKRKNNLIWTILFLFVITIPLLLMTNKVVEEKDQQVLVEETMMATISDAKIKDIEIENKKEITTINITIEYPGELSEESVDDIKEILSDKIDRTVVLKVTIIPVVRFWEINN